MYHFNVAGHGAVYIGIGSMQAMPAQPSGSMTAVQHFVGASNTPHSVGAVPVWSHAGASPNGQILPRQSLVQSPPYSGELPLDLSARGNGRSGAFSALAATMPAQAGASSIKAEMLAKMETAMLRAAAEGKVPVHFNELSSPQQFALQWHWLEDGERVASLEAICSDGEPYFNSIRNYVVPGGKLTPMGENLLRPSAHRDARRRDPVTGYTLREMVAMEWHKMSANDRAHYTSMKQFCESRGTTANSVAAFVSTVGELSEMG
ncbi:hypothetical protein, partial [Pseudoxanthomonas sp. UTMC 1351]|uniref:hypothetical protein n=1 Tax=Pseudoxanthomonas sp. UTMC 1351 TaxID=2695853 RepID=UPI0034CDCEAD